MQLHRNTSWQVMQSCPVQHGSCMPESKRVFRALCSPALVCAGTAEQQLCARPSPKASRGSQSFWRCPHMWYSRLRGLSSLQVAHLLAYSSRFRITSKIVHHYAHLSPTSSSVKALQSCFQVRLVSARRAKPLCGACLTSPQP